MFSFFWKWFGFSGSGGPRPPHRVCLHGGDYRRVVLTGGDYRRVVLTRPPDAC